MKLTENKILVKVENEKVSAGGIFIPEVNKTVGIVCGTVVSAGPGRLNPYTGVRVENNVKPGDRVIFNIGTATAINLLDLVAIINKVMGKNIPPQLIENPIKSGYIKTQLAGIEKIATELGYAPSVSLEEGIKEIVDNLDPARIPLMRE